MNRSKRSTLLNLAILVLVTAVPAVVQADQTRVRLEARLSPTAVDPTAEGNARFESRSGRARFRVEVEDVSVTGAVEVTVNGKLVATLTLTNGFGELDLNTQDGDTVPALQAGDEVEVVDATDGVTILLAGVLGPK